MKTILQKWDDSLVVSIPEPLAEELGLTEGSAIEMRRSEGGLLLEPCEPPSTRVPTLDRLLEGVEESNRHDEVATGSAQGSEHW